MQWSFSYNSFVKFHVNKIWEPQYDHVISNPCWMRCVIKGLLVIGRLSQQSYGIKIVFLIILSTTFRPNNLLFIFIL